MEITSEQALKNLAMAAAQFNGNLEQHKLLQKSLEIVGHELNKLKFQDKVAEEQETASPLVNKGN